MKSRQSFAGWFSAVLCGAILAAFPGPAGAQQPRPAQSAQKEERNKDHQKEKPWQPAVVPAGVLVFGAQLEDAAPREVRDWLWSYVKKNLRDSSLEPKQVIGAVDERYASASDLARDAGIYLVYYLAYKDDEENQRALSSRIRDIDRETYDITRQLDLMWESEQNHLASTRASPLTPEQRVRRDEEVQKLNARLRELADERQIKATQMVFSRNKVNIYLKLMSYAFNRMQGTDPAVLNELK